MNAVDAVDAARGLASLPRTPIALAVLMLGCGAAYGAEPAAPAEPTEVAAAASVELDEVQVHGTRAGDFKPGTSSVGAKTDTALRDIPQSVTVINRAVLDAQNATNLTDALRNVPGITLSAGEGGQIGDNVNLRGFTARTDIFLDGARDRAQYRRDTFELDSIEVLKGPSSLFFGRGSTGGVINQVTKLPSLKAARSVTGSIGTDDWYRTTIDLNQPLSDHAAVRLNAFAQDIGSTRDVVDARDFGLAPSLRFGIGEASEFTISALVQRNADIPDYGLPFAFGRVADVSRNRFYGDTDDYFDQDANVVRARWDQRFNGNLALRNQVIVQDTHVEARPTPYRVCTAAFNTAATPCPVSPPGTPLDQVTVQSDRRDRLVDDYSLYDQLDLLASFDTGPFRHSLVFGGEVGQDRTRARNFATSPRQTDSLGNFTPGPTADGTTRTATTDTRGVGDTLAIYVNDAVTLTPTFKAVAGIRYDRYQAHSNALTVATGARTVFERTDTATSVRGGLIWQPVDWISSYVSYGTSFNPSAEAVTISAAQALVGPERNRSYELGTKLDLLNNTLSLSAAAFLIDRTDARTTDPVTNTVRLDGRTQVRGFEVSAVGRVTPALQIIGGYTFLDSELVDTLDGSGTGAARISFEGNRLPNTPRNAASLFTTYRVGEIYGGQVETGGGVYYVGPRYVTTANTTQVDAYTRCDLTVAWLRPTFDLRLNVQNLLDSAYLDAIIASENGRAVPGRGRTVVATVGVRF